MKGMRIALALCSYICQYLMPIILFGFVVPYYHGSMGLGATGAGIVALCIALLLIYGKLKVKISDNCKGAWHGILLSIFPISIWVILGIGIGKVLSFVNMLVDYWWIAFIFIIIGRICAIVVDVLAEKEINDGQ